MEHRNITGADNHEPKGIETASSGQVYVANGSGSGAWTTLASAAAVADKVVLTTRIADISTPGSVYVVSPYAGTLVAVYVVLHGAITGANSIVTCELGGVPVGGLSITVAQSGSAAGSVFSDTSISGSNSVSAGQAIEVITDGGSTGAVAADVTLVIDT